jgi:hypothetical protein
LRVVFSGIGQFGVVEEVVGSGVLEDVAAVGSGVVEEVGGLGEVDVLLSMLGSP